MELSEKQNKIIELVKQLNVVELNDLVKALELEFWVTAMQMVVSWWAWDWSADSKEEKSDLINVELTEIWQQKINVIKVIKDLLWLWLKEAKELVEKAPVVIKENSTPEDAENFKLKLTEVWAVVNFK